MSGTTLYESAVCLISSGSKIPHTVVVCANLEGLVSAHNQSCLSVLLVLQESHITGTTLLPLVGLADELEELGAHLEGLLLNFLTGLNVNLLGEMNDWLEVDILGGWGFILFYHQLFGSRCVIDRHFGLLIVSYLWVLSSGGFLLGLGRSGVITTVLILDLFLLRTTTEHREDRVLHSCRGSGSSSSHSGCGLFNYSLYISESAWNLDVCIKEILCQENSR
jgi:hypothetical protein